MIPIKTEIRSNQNLLEYLREKGYELPSPCGGKGICGKCRVRILEGIKTLAMPYTGFHEITLDEWEKDGDWHARPDWMKRWLSK